MLDTTYAWAPITKMEKDDDGTLLVYGPAASPDLDRDRQRLNPDWLGKAMPAWFEQGANIREQHDGRRAVGVGVGLSKADGDVHMLAARIVDPIAVAKCEHGVLKGFSVGIKSPKVTMGKADAPGGEIIGGDIIEVSVVDRPCNPTTLFEIAKADGADGDLTVVEDAQVTEKTDAEAFGLPQELYDRLATPVKDALTSLATGGATVTAEPAAETEKVDGPEAAPVPVVVNVSVAGQPLTGDDLLDAMAKADLSAAGRRKAAASGAAMKDGSYPIESKADLRKAIKAVGRGGADHDAIRKHIIGRAKALGLADMIPDNWNSDGSLKETAAKADAPDADTIAKAAQIVRDVHTLVPSLATKADDGDSTPDESMDIAGAEDAIAVIAKLIIAEAESLGEGNLNEAMDISLLLDAVRSLSWFKCREEQEENGVADMALADQPDTTKADTPSGTPATPQTSGAPDGAGTDPATGTQPDAAKSETPTLTKADVAALIETAVAKAEEAAKERETALAADLAKAQEAIEAFQALPQPGGPVLTRTSTQEAQARGGDAALLRAQAAEYQRKADATTDRDLRGGYLEKARDLLAKADA